MNTDKLLRVANTVTRLLPNPETTMTLTWAVTAAVTAPTPDGGYYLITELPATRESGTHRVRAQRTRYDERGRQWEYTLGQFRTMDAARKACEDDYKAD